MDRIPLSEKFLIFLVNKLKEFIQLNYYLLWFLLDPRKFSIINPKKIKKILVVSGGAVGDAYNVVGAINSVVSKYPVEISLLTHEKNRKFVKNPKIKSVSLDETKKLLSKKEFDAVVLIDPGRDRKIYDKDIFFGLLNIPYVVSSDSLKLAPKKIKNYFPILANRKVYPIGANGPMTFLKLFNLLGYEINAPEFYFTKQSEEFAKKFFKRYIKKRDIAIIIHPGAGKILMALNEGKLPAHLWPEERWAKLADKLISTNKNIKIILTGLDSESVVTQKVYELIKNKKRVVYAVGKTSDVESLASILKRAKATVTPDTSTAHISSHVKTPAVILYSSDPPKRIRPVSSKNIDIYHYDKAHNCRRYACKYCHNVHMKSISVDEVYSSVMRLIK